MRVVAHGVAGAAAFHFAEAQQAGLALGQCIQPCQQTGGGVQRVAALGKAGQMDGPAVISTVSSHERDIIAPAREAMTPAGSSGQRCMPNTRVT